MGTIYLAKKYKTAKSASKPTPYFIKYAQLLVTLSSSKVKPPSAFFIIIITLVVSIHSSRTIYVFWENGKDIKLKRRIQTNITKRSDHMIWQDYARQLKEVLALDGSPVGVTFSDVPAGNGKEPKIMACAAFYQAARKGTTFNISAETCTCPGGSTFLGLSAPSPERAALTRKFLIEGEKFSSCNASFFRGRALSQSQPPLGVAKYVVIGPLEKSEFKPDLVLFLCNPAQASRLVVLSTYETGIPLQGQLNGSTCGGAVTYPLSTGRVNVTFLDPSSRHLVKGFKDSDLIFSAPFFYVRSIVESIPLCTAGTAKPGMGYDEIMKK